MTCKPPLLHSPFEKDPKMARTLTGKKVRSHRLGIKEGWIGFYPTEIKLEFNLVYKTITGKVNCLENTL